jgi:hypothetical protein
MESPPTQWLGTRSRRHLARESWFINYHTGWEETMVGPSKKQRAWSWWYLLLLVQFVAVLWPPFYNRVDPSWGGMPFFYWYQLVWIILGAVLTAIVYFATED